MEILQAHCEATRPAPAATPDASGPIGPWRSLRTRPAGRFGSPQSPPTETNLTGPSADADLRKAVGPPTSRKAGTPASGHPELWPTASRRIQLGSVAVSFSERGSSGN